MDKIKNASVLPKVYFGLHMAEGVAEYREPDKAPLRVLINENTIKKMDVTFRGRPVYVRHVDQVDLSNLQEEADGYVIRSFFNKADGKHWAEFIVVSDRGHDAIAKGWRLSNAYIPGSDYGVGGQWHGVDYQKEILSGEYEHLAIVDDPRYDESVVMTPEQFKNYNEEKENQLQKLANAKDKGAPGMFEIFKRTKHENSKELEGLSVKLPKSGVEMTLAKLINDMDESMNDKDAKDCYANGDHKIKVGEEEMTVNELLGKHMMMKDEMDKIKAEKDAAGEEGSEEDKKKKENEAKEADEKKANEAKAADEKKANEAKEAEEKKANEAKESEKIEEKKQNALYFDALKNAKAIQDPIKVDLEKAARGKQRYGSN